MSNARPSSSRSTLKPRQKSSAARAASGRKFVVFASLVGGLTLTSALLLALAPESLRPDSVKSLFAAGEPQSLEPIFDTPVPVQADRWRYIFIHHSRTPAGDALSLADGSDGAPDHFVIGNGQGCQDGELQITQRWVQQAAPGKIAGLPRTQPNFVSVCMVGDFDQSQPTPTQERRLLQLLGALQTRLRIPPQNVVLTPKAVGVAGVGAYFPLADVRQQLVP